MKNTVYSFKMLSLLIVLAFSNYSMAQINRCEKDAANRVGCMEGGK